MKNALALLFVTSRDMNFQLQEKYNDLAKQVLLTVRVIVIVISSASLNSWCEFNG